MSALLLTTTLDASAALTCLLLVTTLAVTANLIYVSMAKRRLQRWAIANGYSIDRSEIRYLRRGPFWWRTSCGQAVFRISVSDSQGHFRSGFVRVAGYFFGVWSDAATVIWDHPFNGRGFEVELKKHD